MRQGIGLFLLILMTLVSTSCSDGKSSSRASEADVFNDGFELVEQGQYENAILYFQNVYQKNPTDNALKAWASVYLSRAQVKISSLYLAFEALPKPGKVNQENILSLIKSYQQALEKIPYVQVTARQDLEIASAILKSRNSSSVRLFRAALNLVLLRSAFSDGNSRLMDAHFKLDFDENLQLICKLDWKKLRVWILEWTRFGLEMKQDLNFAFPLKSKSWESSGKFFTESRSLTTSISRVCNP